MKRILATLLALVSVLTMMVWPVSAAPSVDLDDLFVSNLNFLDQYYTLGAEFMIQKICGIMYPWDKAEELNYAPLPVPAAEFEAVLNKYFAPTAQQLADIREYPCGHWDGENFTTTPFYDEATDTYQVFFIGGFGGDMPLRDYIGYTASDLGYIVYYATVNYDHLPEEEYAKVEALDWPMEYVYNGKVYENGPDGYTRIESLETYGNKYAVSVNEDNTLRILSQSTYTAADLPPHLGAVSITAQPKTAYAKTGAKVTATVKTKGLRPTYTWYIKNDGATKYSKSSVTSATYSATMGSKVDGRRVYCVVTDAYGNSVKTDTVMLRQKLAIATQPKTTYTKLNATAKVTVKATGTGLKYAWYVRSATGTKYSKSSITSSTYSVKMTSKVKNRRVYCVVTDKYGKKVQTNTVILRQAASIVTQPKSVKVANGKTAKVTVKASGDGLKYTWYIKNAGSKKYSKSSVTKSTYSAKMSSKVNGRLVYCVVTDKYGKTVKTSTVKLSKK
ncbi:MAG: hypothetical protein IJO42_02440 [Clostridia bacterium]|nr:hypothetical protein [Clostridia bacterium]